MSAINKILIAAILLSLFAIYIFTDSGRYDVKSSDTMSVLVDKHTGRSWLLTKDGGRHYWRPIFTHDRWLKLVELEELMNTGLLDSALNKANR